MVFGQAQNGVNFEFQVKFDLEGHGQLPPNTIGILTKVFCFSGPNLVILAWTGDELLCGQASDWYTHTDTGNDNTRRPKLASGKNYWQYHEQQYIKSVQYVLVTGGIGGYHFHSLLWPLIARFMGPTWGPSGADRTQVGPMLVPQTLLFGAVMIHQLAS